MRLSVSPADPRPPFAQIRAQLHDAILTGVLADGTQLPPVRQLAADLGLANGTVARAYRELETEGLVRTARGAGTRVVAPSSARRSERHRARDLVDRCVDEARALGLGDDQIVELMLDAVRRRPSA